MLEWTCTSKNSHQRSLSTSDIKSQVLKYDGTKKISGVAETLTKVPNFTLLCKIQCIFSRSIRLDDKLQCEQESMERREQSQAAETYRSTMASQGLWRIFFWFLKLDNVTLQRHHVMSVAPALLLGFVRTISKDHHSATNTQELSKNSKHDRRHHKSFCISILIRLLDCVINIQFQGKNNSWGRAAPATVQSAAKKSRLCNNQILQDFMAKLRKPTDLRKPLGCASNSSQVWSKCHVYESISSSFHHFSTHTRQPSPLGPTTSDCSQTGPLHSVRWVVAKTPQKECTWNGRKLEAFHQV